MGTNTDPYQRAEAKYRLTRGVLEALAEHANSVLDPDQIAAGDAGSRRTTARCRVARRRGELLARHAGPARLARDRAGHAESASPHRGDGEAVRRRHPHRRARRPDPAGHERPARAAARGASPRSTGRRPIPRLRPAVPASRRAASTSSTGSPATDPELHADYLRRYATSDYAPKRYLDDLYRRAGLPRRGS